MPHDQMIKALDAAAEVSQLAEISSAVMRVYTEQFGREPERRERQVRKLLTRPSH